MEYVYDYHQTLDELKAASEELLAKPHGVFFNTQVRKTLMAKYLFLISSHSLTLHGEDYAVAMRKQLNCSHCARFFSRMASVVYLTAEGAHSVYWNPEVVSDPVMKLVVADMKRFVEEARVQTIFNREGSYAHYTEHTNHGGKEFRHYYVNAALMKPVSPLTLNVIRMPDLGKFHGQVEALIRFAVQTPFSAVAVMDQWFQSGVIKHVGDSENTLPLAKGFLASIATLKASPYYETLGNPYARETAIVNMVWRYALADQNLLTLKNSLLGKTITKVVELEKTGAADTNIAAVQGFWKTQSSGLKYQRTTAPASGKQVGSTLLFLEENGYMDSLGQVETSEDMLPVVWSSKGKYREAIKEAPVTQTSFAAFAAEKTKQVAENASEPFKVPGITDVGYFYNEVMPHVESMALLVPRQTRLRPCFFNTMANPQAKKIFTYDTDENPCPHIMFAYEDVFQMGQLTKKSVEELGDKFVLNVLSVTTPKTIGLDKNNSTPCVVFLLDDVTAPGAGRPTLFATALKGELYDHRRALEDYSNTTMLPRCEGNQAIGFPIGAHDPHTDIRGRMTSLELRVKYTKEHAVLMGREFAIYNIGLTGYHVVPDYDKYPRLDRNPVVEADVPAEAPAVDLMKTQAPANTASAS